MTTTATSFVDEAKQRMGIIQGVRTSDGQIFDDEKKALEHESKLLFEQTVEHLVNRDVEINHMHPADVVHFLRKNRAEILRLLA